jgi:hypothetical protein
MAARGRLYRQRHPDRVHETARRSRARKSDVWHGVSKSALIATQNGLCAICGKRPAAQVDHDHAHCPGFVGCPQCVRGALCQLCNNGLGSFKDSVATLRRAIEYLERWSR